MKIRAPFLGLVAEKGNLEPRKGSKGTTGLQKALG